MPSVGVVARVTRTCAPHRRLGVIATVKMMMSMSMSLVLAMVTASGVDASHVTFPMHLRRAGNISRGLLGAAEIPLHGSVRESGYYYADIQFGTPPQNFTVITDTGSTLTYVPCTGCNACGSHMNPPLDTSASTTFTAMDCSTPACTEQCRAGNTCGYSRTYAEGSSSMGALVKDVLRLTLADGVAGAPTVAFGCVEKETGDIKSQRADGIMGLGRGDVSIPTQLFKANITENAFSLCYGAHEKKTRIARVRQLYTIRQRDAHRMNTIISILMSQTVRATSPQVDSTAEDF